MPPKSGGIFLSISTLKMAFLNAVSFSQQTVAVFSKQVAVAANPGILTKRGARPGRLF